MNRPSQRSIEHALICVSIAALTFLVYSRTLTFDFVNWDDDVYLHENHRVQNFSTEHLLWFFTHPYYHAYVPVTMLSHMIDVRAWGNLPAGHHLTNVLLHAVNTSLIFLLTFRILSLAHLGTVSRISSATIRFSAVIAALAYSFHPLRAESVAWVSDRKDLLCCLFFLAALHTYVTYSRAVKKRGVFFGATLVMFLIACLSKPIAITAPFIFLLIDVLLLRRRDFKAMIVEKLPFIAISMLVGLVAFMISPDNSPSDMFSVMSQTQRVLLPMYNSVFYIVKILMPVGLSPLYPLASELEMIVTLGVFVFISAVCIAMRKRSPFMLLAWLCYLVTIAPASVITSNVMQTTADRYTYLPSIALFVPFGGLIAAAWRHFSSNLVRRVALATALIGVGFLAHLTIRQQGIWANSVTLWTRAIELYPGMASPYNNLGLALQAQGEVTGAEIAYSRAIELKPDYVEAHVNLGTLMFERNDFEKAERFFFQAAALRPASAEILNNLGMIARADGRSTDAISLFQRSVTINPEFAQGYFNLGLLYEQMGNHAASADALRKAADLGHRLAQSRVQTGSPSP